MAEVIEFRTRRPLKAAPQPTMAAGAAPCSRSSQPYAQMRQLAELLRSIQRGDREREYRTHHVSDLPFAAERRAPGCPPLRAEHRRRRPWRCLWAVATARPTPRHYSGKWRTIDEDRAVRFAQLWIASHGSNLRELMESLTLFDTDSTRLMQYVFFRAIMDYAKVGLWFAGHWPENPATAPSNGGAA